MQGSTCELGLQKKADKDINIVVCERMAATQVLRCVLCVHPRNVVQAAGSTASTAHTSSYGPKLTYIPRMPLHDFLR
jgi:hypothetical protein